MKKIITISILALCVLSFFVSCNDGEEGLFQMAGNSVKKEAYSVLQIVNRKNEDTLIVSTDNGIAEYNVSSRSFSDFRGTGVMATNVIWADSNGDDFVWFDTKSDKFLDQDNNEVVLPELNGKTPQPFYSPDGINFTYVFIDGDGYYWTYYSTSAPVSPADIVPEKVSTEKLKAVSIIGNGILRVIRADGSIAVYYCDTKIFGTSDSYPAGYVRENNIIIDSNGLISVLEGEVEKNSDTTVQGRPAMFVGDKFTYIIVPKYNKVLQVKVEDGEPTLSSIVVNGLQNVEVISIIKEEERKLYILTSDSGVRTIDLNAKTIN